MIKSAYISLIIILVCACQSSNTQSSQIVLDSLLIEMTKTPCLGSCADYEVKVSNSGGVEFIGRANVPKTDTVKFVLDKGDFKDLKIKIKETDFLTLEDRYYSDVTDLPTTYTTYHYGQNESKKIMNYYGAPSRLKEMESYLEKLIFKYLEDR